MKKVKKMALGGGVDPRKVSQSGAIAQVTKTLPKPAQNPRSFPSMVGFGQSFGKLRSPSISPALSAGKKALGAGKKKGGAVKKATKK